MNVELTASIPADGCVDLAWRPDCPALSASILVIEERDGEAAYGLTYPGQVVRLGVGDIAGAGSHVACPVCGLRLAVTVGLGLGAVDEDDADSALLVTPGA